MAGDNGEQTNDQAVQEAAMIRAIAENLALRFGLDLVDGKLMERPVLMLLFMNENLLNRVELLEEVINRIKKEADPNRILLP